MPALIEVLLLKGFCVGPETTWKVLEFYLDTFQDYPVLEKDFRSWKILETCLPQAIKFSEFP